MERDATTMGVVVICGLLMCAAVAAAVGWGGRRFVAPPPAPDPSAAEVARRFVWYVSLVFTAGVTVGIGVMGAGGRLAMRLLAVTAGDDAQGRLTEAGENVGRITVDGTIGFVLFAGVFGGAFAAAIYLLVRRFLPPGRIGGLVFGAGIFVVLGPLIDPIRSDNPDFGIVGPGWVAIGVFAALALVLGASPASWSSA